MVDPAVMGYSPPPPVAMISANPFEVPAGNQMAQWYYIDSSNVIQGPFLANQMFTWLQQRFFEPTLMIGMD